MIHYKDIGIVDGKSKQIIVDGHRKIVNKYPSKEELKSVIKWNFKYNEEGVCSRCREEDRITDRSQLYPLNACKEKDKNGKFTGRWICHSCWKKDYEKIIPNSYSNTKKSMRYRRNGNLLDDKHLLGDLTQDIACELYGWVDLNKIYDNYNTPIDCYDPKTGLYHQVQGRLYNPYGYWPFTGFERLFGKEYKSIICICYNDNGTIVEEIYEFPPNVIEGRTSIKIYKNPMNKAGTSPIIPWYEHCRIVGGQRVEKIMKLNDILARNDKK